MKKIKIKPHIKKIKTGKHKPIEKYVKNIEEVASEGGKAFWQQFLKAIKIIIVIIILVIIYLIFLVIKK